MQENKKGFKLSKVNWILALVTFVISGFIFFRLDGINEFSIGYFVGIILASLIFTFVITLIIWLIRGRKIYDGSYTFNIAICLMCLITISNNFSASNKKNESVKKLSKSISNYKEKINNGNDNVAAYKEHAKNVNLSLLEMINNTNSNDRQVYIRLREFTSINNAVIIEWQKAYYSLEEPRILDYSLLNNPEEFNYQIGIVKEYQKQSENYKIHIENRKTLIEKLFKEISKENQTLKGVIIGINSTDSIQKPIFKPFINSHISYSQNLLELLTFLEENKTKWSYNNDSLSFTNNKVEENYILIIEKIAKEEKLVNQWNEKMMKTL